MSKIDPSKNGSLKKKVLIYAQKILKLNMHKGNIS